jgi:hypothetical protein
MKSVKWRVRMPTFEERLATRMYGRKCRCGFLKKANVITTEAKAFTDKLLSINLLL